MQKQGRPHSTKKDFGKIYNAFNAVNSSLMCGAFLYMGSPIIGGLFGVAAVGATGLAIRDAFKRKTSPAPNAPDGNQSHSPHLRP